VQAPAWTAIDWRPHVHDRVIAGRSVRYVDYGEGPPLLLMHGLGCCWQWWLRNLPALGRTRRVIAVDLPGFGASDPLVPPAAEMTDHAAAMLALCDALGLDRVTAGGHSMGGLVALAMAALAPERVARVIMVNAGGVPMTEARLSAVVGVIRLSHAFLRRPGVLRALSRRPRLRGGLSKVAVGSRDALSGELATLVVPQMNAPGFVDAVIAAARAVRDAAPERVRCPVLLLWGDRDPIVPVSAARAMAKRLEHPTLALMPGSGHAPMVQDPEAFNRAVLEFTEPEDE
jgi:pimeloyl-ACP methyl ester carboxylesterase